MRSAPSSRRSQACIKRPLVASGFFEEGFWVGFWDLNELATVSLEVCKADDEATAMALKYRNFRRDESRFFIEASRLSCVFLKVQVTRDRGPSCCFLSQYPTYEPLQITNSLNHAAASVVLCRVLRADR